MQDAKNPHKSLNSKRPILKKGEFLLNFPRVISEFEATMQKFPVKNVLYQAVFQGRGVEFDSYRKIGPGDDAGLIDWRASLRSNEILGRKYVDERNLNIYFLVDVSNSMLFGSSNKLKAEYAAEFVAALSHLILGSGDRAGLILFNDDLVKVLHPSNSKSQFSLFTKFLSDPNLYGGGFDIDKALEHALDSVNSQYTVFIIVSDFISGGNNAERSLKLMGAKFETIAVMIRDPADEILPKTHYQFAIQGPYSRRQMVLDPDIASKVYQRNAIRQKAVLRDIFKKSNIDFLEINTHKPFAVYFANFLKARSSGRRV